MRPVLQGHCTPVGAWCTRQNTQGLGIDHCQLLLSTEACPKLIGRKHVLLVLCSLGDQKVSQVFVRITEAKDRYGRWRASQMYIVLQAQKSFIAVPFVDLILKAVTWPHVAPTRRPESPLDSGNGGRIRVEQEDKLGSRFLSGCLIHELASTPSGNLDVMDEFVVSGIIRSHTITPGLGSVANVATDALGVATDAHGLVPSGGGGESSDDDITGGRPGPDVGFMYDETAELGALCFFYYLSFFMFLFLFGIITIIISFFDFQFYYFHFLFYQV